MAADKPADPNGCGGCVARRACIDDEDASAGPGECHSRGQAGSAAADGRVAPMAVNLAVGES